MLEMFLSADCPSSITSLSTSASISSSSSASSSSSRFIPLNSSRTSNKTDESDFKFSEYPLNLRNSKESSRNHGELILSGFQSLMFNKLLCDVTLVAQGKLLNFFCFNLVEFFISKLLYIIKELLLLHNDQIIRMFNFKDFFKAWRRIP